MYIPAQFLPINTTRAKPAKRNAISLEKSESNPDTAKHALNSQVLMYDKREGEDRRKRKVKPLLDTRVGRDRRYDVDRPSVNIKA